MLKGYYRGLMVLEGNANLMFKVRTNRYCVIDVVR